MTRTSMEQIGRYDVERLLARGGMAEVFVGKASGPGGFSKRVVIKRILPDLAEDPVFVEMFLSEARLAALLNHPNVVQVFEFGQHEGQYFLAMEYVAGQTVRSMMRSFQRKGKTMPPEIAARIVVSVCEGLHYAHCLCDDEGRPYQIVHRDVAPDNVIVSTAGVPKVVDFGIAKAESNVHRSEAGTVKGKYAYMSPEHIRGEPVDRQLDVYALGVMLFELVAGRRPFEAATDLGLMHAILAGNPPAARSVNPEVPEVLSHIISVAMHAEREQRYASAHDLQLALEEWLQHAGSRLGPAELASLVREVSLEREGRPSQNRVRSIAPTPGVRHSPGSASTPAHAPEQEPSVDAAPPPRWRGPVIVGALALGLVAGGVGMALTRGAPSVEVRASPTPAVVAPPAVALAPPTPAPKIPEATAVRETPVDAPVEAPAQSAPSPRPARGRVHATGEDGFLTLRTEPWADVFLGSEQLGSTPLVRASVPSGRHTLLVRNEKAGLRRTLIVVVQPGEETKQALVVPTGSLVIDAAPGTEVALDGAVLGVTPLGPLDVVEGRHEVRLGEVVKVVKVHAERIEHVAL